MNVASQDLCEELYELSGWYMTHYIWRYYPDDMEERMPAESVQTFTNIRPEDYQHTDHQYHPAYDLGYLLRKLQSSGFDHVNLVITRRSTVGVTSPTVAIAESGQTPEDAAAKLACELFKRGILTKEAGDVS